ncbi:Neutral alpha-glucosidase AB [Liparis tanakae]|uniref:Neutral alpha-glucosidase AB n=1 Tax=Liparis tanakae TaxID=230148 RepID=A0A4Z2EAG1_9TELE|nr:Neutral alpha-glucosidase AB [Liparis tanakae]
MSLSSSSSLSLLSQDENGVVLSLGSESQRVIVSARPFRLDIMEGPEVLMSLNSRGLLAFEHLRMRKDTMVLLMRSKAQSLAERRPLGAFIVPVDVLVLQCVGSAGLDRLDRDLLSRSNVNVVHSFAPLPLACELQLVHSCEGAVP